VLPYHICKISIMFCWLSDFIDTTKTKQNKTKKKQVTFKRC
jgi:energy-converting hydrogenase A subunit M